MKKLITLASVFISIIILAPSVALAAKPANAGKPDKPSGGGGGDTSELVGYDISYPQCGRRLPTDHYFSVIGVNGGNAVTFNPCLKEQLEWANTARDGSNQEKIQLYVNTAHPAQESTYSWASWPTSSVQENPYGNCVGERTVDEACSWQYGWNRSIDAESHFVTKAQEAGLEKINTADYIWWLDVEIGNSWQSGSDEVLILNTIALEGFAKYYQSKGATVGLYSTAYQWNEITGNLVDSDKNLRGLDNWRPSGTRLSTAISNCNVEPLTDGGAIVLTQYVKKNLDHNHSCL